jgi:hypothetical protein
VSIDGLILSRSISEMVEGDVPDRAATSLTPRSMISVQRLRVCAEIMLYGETVGYCLSRRDRRTSR